MLGTINISDIDKDSFENIVDPLDRMLTNYQEACRLSYASSSTLTVGAGEIKLSNAGGTIRLMQKNTSSITATWGMIDTGSEENSKTYYIWAYQETVADTDFDICVSTSSSAPSGKTYFARIGDFYNDSSGNITLIDNDNEKWEFGTKVSKSDNVSYQAATDGFFLGTITTSNVSGARIFGYSDSANPPTTMLGSASVCVVVGGIAETAYLSHDSFCIPVKAGDYYKGVKSYTVGAPTVAYWWIPKQ